MTGIRESASQEELFLRNCTPEPNSGCWLFLGFINPKTGYGTYRLREGRYMTTAHRASWLIFKGAIPEGLDLDHKCRVRSCVNPDHLEPVTRQENLRRGIGNAGKTHCIHGHAFTPENTWIEKTGGRHCRRCHAETERKRKARLRA